MTTIDQQRLDEFLASFAGDQAAAMLSAQAPGGEFAAVAAEAGFANCRRVAETPLHRVLEITP